jgi:hypothetical protein
MNAGTVVSAQVQQGPPIRGKGDQVEAAPVRFRCSAQPAPSNSGTTTDRRHNAI